MSRKATAKPSSAIAVLIEAEAWEQHSGLSAKLRRAAKAALAATGAPDGSLTVLLADDERLRALNAQFRRLDKPTNVLSFPSLPNGEMHLGDIAIAYGVAEQEAKESGKEFADHVLHLTVHGVLHLLGYDHETEPQAAVMEALETSILAEMDIPDPYAALRAAKEKAA